MKNQFLFIRNNLSTCKFKPVVEGYVYGVTSDLDYLMNDAVALASHLPGAIRNFTIEDYKEFAGKDTDYINIEKNLVFMAVDKVLHNSKYPNEIKEKCTFVCEKMTVITQNQAMERYSVTHQYFTQLRKGGTRIVNGKRYSYPPKLQQGLHYFWDEGRVYYYQLALDKFFGKL